MVQLWIGAHVLRECEAVVRRKAPASLPTLARLLALGGVASGGTPSAEQIHLARSLVAYAPDAQVLAEALAAQPDWFVTHDSHHFLKSPDIARLRFQVGTPGDFIQAFLSGLTQAE